MTQSIRKGSGGTRDMTALNLLVRPAEYNEAGEVVEADFVPGAAPASET